MFPIRKSQNKLLELFFNEEKDYVDIIYHNQRHALMKLIEQVQYKVALIVMDCRQGTSREKLYDELGWEPLHKRRWKTIRRIRMGTSS